MGLLLPGCLWPSETDELLPAAEPTFPRKTSSSSASTTSTYGPWGPPGYSIGGDPVEIPPATGSILRLAVWPNLRVDPGASPETQVMPADHRVAWEHFDANGNVLGVTGGEVTRIVLDHPMAVTSRYVAWDGEGDVYFQHSVGGVYPHPVLLFELQNCVIPAPNLGDECMSADFEVDENVTRIEGFLRPAGTVSANVERVTVIDANGDVVDSPAMSTSTDGFWVKLDIPESAPRGTWRIEVDYGAAADVWLNGYLYRFMSQKVLPNDQLPPPSLAAYEAAMPWKSDGRFVQISWRFPPKFGSDTVGYLARTNIANATFEWTVVDEWGNLVVQSPGQQTWQQHTGIPLDVSDLTLSFNFTPPQEPGAYSGLYYVRLRAFNETGGVVDDYAQSEKGNSWSGNIQHAVCDFPSNYDTHCEPFTIPVSPGMYDLVLTVETADTTFRGSLTLYDAAGRIVEVDTKAYWNAQNPGGLYAITRLTPEDFTPGNWTAVMAFDGPYTGDVNYEASYDVEQYREPWPTFFDGWTRP